MEDTGSYIYLSCGHFLRNKGDKGSCPDGLIQTLDRLKIDGDGLLFIGEEFFSQVLKSVKPEEVDTMKEFFKVMQKIQQVFFVDSFFCRIFLKLSKTKKKG